MAAKKNSKKTEKKESIYALVEVRVRPQVKTGFEETAQHIFQDPCVVDHYLISGKFDFLLVLEAESLYAVSDFISYKLSHLDNVVSTETHFILKKYKEKGKVLADIASGKRLPISA